MEKVNLSLNGIPGTLWEIRRQESIHPYLGLRQAILIIDTQEKALRQGALTQKKMRLTLKTQQQDLPNSLGDLREILLDEIEITQYQLDSFYQLLVDAKAELDTAIKEKLRIEKLNPAMIAGTYETIQMSYANESFQCKLARSVVVSVLSAARGISEGAAEVLYDSNCLSAEDQQKFKANIEMQLQQLLLGPVNPSLVSTNGGLNGSVIN